MVNNFGNAQKLSIQKVFIPKTYNPVAAEYVPENHNQVNEVRGTYDFTFRKMLTMII